MVRWLEVPVSPPRPAAAPRRRTTPTPSWGWCGARTGGRPCRCSAASAGCRPTSGGRWRRRRASAGALRLTPWRGVVLPHVPGAAADDLLAELGAAGFVDAPGRPGRGRPPAPGARAVAVPHRRPARRVGRPRSRPLGPPPLPVHWSGCERRCGHPSTTMSRSWPASSVTTSALPVTENPAVDSIHLADAVSSARPRESYVRRTVPRSTGSRSPPSAPRATSAGSRRTRSRWRCG